MHGHSLYVLCNLARNRNIVFRSMTTTYQHSVITDENTTATRSVHGCYSVKLLPDSCLYNRYVNDFLTVDWSIMQAALIYSCL